MIFLSCYQTILWATKDVGLVSGPFVKTLEALSRDPIVDVRIKLARFLGALLGEYSLLHNQLFHLYSLHPCRDFPWHS